MEKRNKNYEDFTKNLQKFNATVENDGVIDLLELFFKAKGLLSGSCSLLDDIPLDLYINLEETLTGIISTLKNQEREN